MLEGPDGVHGLQWRPYSPTDSPPAGAGTRPELRPTAPADQRDAAPGISGSLRVSRPGVLRIDHIDAESRQLLGSIAFRAQRSHCMFWDPTDGTLHIAETNSGHVFRCETPSGELLSEWCIDGPESTDSPAVPTIASGSATLSASGACHRAVTGPS